DAGALSSVEQSFRVGECLRKSKMRRIVEPYPIGVDQSINAAQRFFWLMRFGEIVWKRLNRSAKRIGSLRRIRKCDHLVPQREQALGNVLAREAKSPCYRDPHAGFPSDR